MKKTVPIIISALLAFFLGAGTLFIFLQMPPKSEAYDDTGYVYSTGDVFLTNLKSGGHFVKTDILIEVSDKDTIKILENNNHRIRDQIIEILGDIEEEDIIQSDFKKNLRNLLKEDLQNLLKIDNIKGIYFNEFIIQ